MQPEEVLEFLKSDILGLNLFISFKKLRFFLNTFEKFRHQSIFTQFNFFVFKILVKFFDGTEITNQLKILHEDIEQLKFIKKTIKNEASISNISERITEYFY